MNPPNPNNKRKANETLDSRQSKKRNVILVGTKLEIIQCAKDGATTSDLARKYNLSASTISTILNPAKKDKLIELVAKNKVLEGTKTMKLAHYSDIDKAVDTWFANVSRLKNIAITGPDIKEKSLALASKLNHPDSFFE